MNFTQQIICSKIGLLKTFELFHPQDIQESYSALQSVLVFKTPKAVVNQRINSKYRIRISKRK